MAGYTAMFAPDETKEADAVVQPDRILNAALALIVPVAVVAVEMLNEKEFRVVPVTVTVVFNAVFGEGTPEIVTRDPITRPCPERTLALLATLAAPAVIELIVIGPEAFPV